MSTLVVERPHRSASGRLVEFLRAAGNQAKATFTAWRNRRAVADLLDSDDRMLADIGITRGDVLSALSLPAGRDPSARLVVLSVERRSARAALRQDASELESLRRTA